MKNAETIRAREARELARREKQLQAKNNRFYMLYLFMVLSLIYIIDEIASTISIQFQSNIINEFFVQNMGLEYGEGLSLSSALGFITYPVTLLIVFYRPLADRFGRKPFLVINTLMMGMGLFLVYLSRNIFVYMVGGTLMGFMVSHDMQCVYILECSSEKNRARNYALTKAVAILGTLLIPLLRATLMKNQSERWHLVYLVPAILGFVLSLAALLFAKETNTFVVNRVKYLKTPVEEREKQTREEKNNNAQGGILNAVKFAFRHRQLRFLMLACCFFYSASLATATYNTVMKESALMTEEAITLALYLYPVGNALMTFIAGLVSDRFGRKITIIAMSCSAVVCYSLFILVIILLLVLSVFGNSLNIFIEEHVPILSKAADWLIQARIFIAPITLVLFTLLTYKFLPNRKDRYMKQLPGAVFAAIGWMVVSWVFSVYVDVFEGFSTMYGSLTTIVLIMLWLYFCMYSILIGGEINVMMHDKLFTGKETDTEEKKR